MAPTFNVLIVLIINNIVFSENRPEVISTSFNNISDFFNFSVSHSSASIVNTQKILQPDWNNDFTSTQLFYISFALEDTAELKPCISSETVSTQP